MKCLKDWKGKKILIRPEPIYEKIIEALNQIAHAVKGDSCRKE